MKKTDIICDIKISSKRPIVDSVYNGTETISFLGLKSGNLFLVVASLQRALLVNALCETSWLDKPPHHIKVGFIEGDLAC